MDIYRYDTQLDSLIGKAIVDATTIDDVGTLVETQIQLTGDHPNPFIFFVDQVTAYEFFQETS